MASNSASLSGIRRLRNVGSGKEVTDMAADKLKCATKEEIELMKLHIANTRSISLSQISRVWRDEYGRLCVEYGDAGYWHYNAGTKEWW